MCMYLTQVSLKEQSGNGQMFSLLKVAGGYFVPVWIQDFPFKSIYFWPVALYYTLRYNCFFSHWGNCNKVDVVSLCLSLGTRKWSTVVCATSVLKTLTTTVNGWITVWGVRTTGKRKHGRMAHFSQRWLLRVWGNIVLNIILLNVVYFSHFALASALLVLWGLGRVTGKHFVPHIKRTRLNPIHLIEIKATFLCFSSSGTSLWRCCLLRWASSCFSWSSCSSSSSIIWTLPVSAPHNSLTVCFLLLTVP